VSAFKPMKALLSIFKGRLDRNPNVRGSPPQRTDTSTDRKEDDRQYVLSTLS
jgi:hypothetical protein